MVDLKHLIWTPYTLKLDMTNLESIYNGKTYDVKKMDNIWQPVHVCIPSRFFMTMPISSLKCYRKKNHVEIFPNLHMALCTITPTNNNQLNKNMVELTNNENNTNLKQNNQENFLYIYSKNPLSSMNFLFYLIIIFWDVIKSFKFLGFKSHPTLTSTSQFLTMSIKGSKFLIPNLNHHKFIIIPST